MNINVTIGVTPELAKLLGSLTEAVQVVIPTEGGQTPAQQPTQPQIVPRQQSEPQQPVPTAQVPTASQQPPAVSAQQQPIQTGAVPTSAPSYTMDQLAVAATQLVDAGKQNDLLTLLNTFGADSLMSLPKEQYGAFATKLREMGANL